MTESKSLRAWRVDRLMTMDELSERAHVSKRTLNDAEKGRTTPKLRTIKRISEALGVDPRHITEFARTLDQMAEDGDQRDDSTTIRG